MTTRSLPLAASAALLVMVSLGAVAGCGDTIESGSVAFDFDGTVIPIDGPGQAVAINNTSSWLGSTVRSRLVMSVAASRLTPPRTAAVARAIVASVVTDALATLCADGGVGGAPGAALAFQSLCAAGALGGASTPRRFCVGIDRFSLADYPGGDATMIPPPDPDVCMATDPTTTTTGPIPAAGFSLTTMASGFGFPLGPPTAAGFLVQFNLTAPATPFTISREVPFIQPILDRSLPAELRLSPLVGDCPVGTRPAATGSCSISFAFAPSQPTTAPRDLTLRLVMAVPNAMGFPTNFTLSSYVALPVFAGTWSVPGGTCVRTETGSTRVHTMSFPLTGASTYLFGGAIFATGGTEPLTTATLTIAGVSSSDGMRVDLPGPVSITVSEPAVGPTLFDDMHEVRVQALVGVQTRIMIIPLRGC